MTPLGEEALRVSLLGQSASNGFVEEQIRVLEDALDTQTISLSNHSIPAWLVEFARLSTASLSVSMARLVRKRTSRENRCWCQVGHVWLPPHTVYWNVLGKALSQRRNRARDWVEDISG